MTDVKSSEPNGESREVSKLKYILWRQDLPVGDPEKISVLTALEWLGVENVEGLLDEIRGES